MAAYQKTIRVPTRGHAHIVDISSSVEQVVRESTIQTGTVNVAGLGSTLGITTLEFEPGCVADLQRALDTIAPPNANYAHNARWGDENGFSHLRSALVGTSQTYPVLSGRPKLGTWQQIVLCDFDDRPRDREITVTVIGD
jgi:secondary thiamine-phosphate synthase enzyme